MLYIFNSIALMGIPFKCAAQEAVGSGANAGYAVSYRFLKGLDMRDQFGLAGPSLEK